MPINFYLEYMNKLEERKKYSSRLNNLVINLFIISISILIIVNLIYFSTTETKLNLDNLLMLLPFNLLGLSLILYCTLIVLYNLLKYIKKED